MKLCKDCKWMNCEESYSMPKCVNPSTQRVEMVLGAPMKIYCAIERTGLSGCGAEGNLWEAKS